MQSEPIAHIRSFNRFYTTIIGLLDQHYLSSEFCLTEVRILYELAQRPQGTTASQLIALLALDKGYLSRLLHQLEKKKLLEKKPSDSDKRSSLLTLSGLGQTTFATLDASSQQQINQLLSALKAQEIDQLIEHMNGIQEILLKTPTP